MGCVQGHVCLLSREQMDIVCDLRPDIDIVPAMTRKILKSNGEVVYRSTVLYLTQDNCSEPGLKGQRQD